MAGRRGIIAVLLVAAAGLVLTLHGGAGETDRADAAPAAAVRTVARVPGTVPKVLRQRNGLVRRSVRLQGAASQAALTAKVTPLTPAQRKRFARRLAGVNPPPRGPVTERDTLVPALGPASDAPDAAALSASGLGAPDYPTVFRDVSVAHGTNDGFQTSNVAEPTVANDRNGLLYTSNFTARVSSDNGLTWNASIEPFGVWSSLRQTPEVAPGFCCDQSAHAVDHDGGSMVFWLMQGLVADENDPPGNALVLSVFRGKDDLIDATGVNDFCAYPLVASDFGLSDNDNFDFPQMSSTDRYLYISVNVGKGKGKNTSYALVMRFSLDDLQDGDCLADPVAWSDSRTKENLIPVQDAEATMFFATHHRDANIFRGDQLRIYSIRDTSSTMETKNVNITDFAPQARNHDCPVQGKNICGKADGRVITGYQAGDTVGWLWTAAQDNNHPFPYVRVAAFDDDTLERVAERDIFNDGHAYNYPAVGVNDDGEVGLTLYKMGGGVLPKALAAVIENPRTWSGDLKLKVVASSVAVPWSGEWGDYAKVFPYDNCDNTFAAGAWVIADAGPQGADHRFVWFGKDGDGCVDLAVRNLTFITNLDDRDGFQRGDTFILSGAVQNSGSADSPPSTVRFFLSKNRKAGPEDTPISGDVAVPAIAYGEQAILNNVASDAIPETFGFPDGDYYVIACADDPDAIEEITDTNNCFVETAQVLRISGGRMVGNDFQTMPRGDLDITVQRPTQLPAAGGSSGRAFRGEVAPGAAILVDEAIVQTGGARRVATPPVRYRLSRAPVADDDDVVTLASRPVGTVRRTRAGNRTTFRVTRRVTVPRGIAPGRWYLVTCVVPPAGREDERTVNDCQVRRAPILVTGSRRARVVRARVADRR